jgi:hypothetical protein
MASVHDIALTAGFLITGVRDFCEFSDQGVPYDVRGNERCLLAIWGQGCFELHAEITQYAPLVAQLCDELYVQLSDSFPGMWDYEVTETLGSRIAAWIVEHDGQRPYPDWVRSQLTLLAVEFLSRADASDWPALRRSLLSVCATLPAECLVSPL